jgi:hydrogenase-4 component F
MTFLFLLFPPVLAALLAFIIRPYRTLVGWVNAVLGLVSFGAALKFAIQATTSGMPIAGTIQNAPTWGILIDSLGLVEVLRADSLSVLLMVCVSGIGVLTLFLSPGLWREDHYTPQQLRRFQIFINLFIASMLLAVSANNVGLMWIAIEATTIFSAFIIPLKVNKTSVEASWKYILICSVGIALAFTGTVLAYFDFVTLSGRVENALNWTVLLQIAPDLHPEVMQLAFVFLLVGYGTKAGLAPMHTWLPDAHSEAPAPLSATMSGVLLAVAIYAILRWKVVVDATLGTGYTNNLLLVLGMLSLLIASFSMVLSKNYKRLLAYSSIEHTGLTCLGLALGPLGTFAALLHLINHSLAKSMLFLLSGRILHRYQSTEISRVSGLIKAMPLTGTFFAVGILAIVGLPPFGIFISEFALIRAGFEMGRPWLMGVVLALLAIAFVMLLKVLNKMLYGQPPEGVTVDEADGWHIIVPLFLIAAFLLILGLTLPAPLMMLLNQSVAIVSK